MATQSSYNHTHSIPNWSPRSAWPREPSAARITNRATRQPSIHHNPLPQWQQLPEPPVPPASLVAPPIATALICPLLPVPSRSRPSWRPPRGLCAVWTFASTGGGAMERAAARICREAGARVTTNTRLVDLNLEHLDRQDDRRIEVIANGLPLWGGKPTRSGYDPRITTDARRGAKATGGGTFAGAALRDIPRISPQPTLQIGGLRIGSGRQVEPGGNLLHQAPGTT